MKKILSTLLVTLLFFNLKLLAQDSTQTVSVVNPTVRPYKWAAGFQLTGIGIGLFNPKGLSVKHFVSDKLALEYVITPGGRNIISSSLLLQRHFPVQNSPYLNWYAGVGLNLDVYQNQPVTSPPEPIKARVTTTTTLLGTFGAEYNFPKVPVILSGDIKTGLFGYSGFGPANRYNNVYGLRPSLSLRYRFSS